MQDEEVPSPSAFSDEVIGKFLSKLRGIDGLDKVADRLEIQLITNGSTKEEALKSALFEESSN
jgi:hypothetical protein